MESIINTFHIDIKTIIAQIINFGIVFAVLYIYALKPLTKVMKDRTEKIEKGIDDAKLNNEILAKTKKEYDEMLLSARNEANNIFQESKKEAMEKRTKMLEEAKEEVTLIIESGRKTLEYDKEKMLKEAKAEIALLSIKIAEKITGRTIDKSFDEKAIKELNNI